MRTTRKKLLRLDTKRHYWNDLDTNEEENDYHSDERRKPRYKQSSQEVFKCKHCRRFVCPLPSGGYHRNHCPFCLTPVMSMTGNQETGWVPAVVQ